MRAVTFKLNSGKEVNALVWKWEASKGFFDALDEGDGGKIKKYQLNDIKEGTIWPDRHRDDYGAKDLLKEAKLDGWS